MALALKWISLAIWLIDLFWAKFSKTKSIVCGLNCFEVGILVVSWYLQKWLSIIWLMLLELKLIAINNYSFLTFLNKCLWYFIKFVCPFSCFVFFIYVRTKKSPSTKKKKLGGDFWFLVYKISKKSNWF